MAKSQTTPEASASEPKPSENKPADTKALEASASEAAAVQLPPPAAVGPEPQLTGEDRLRAERQAATAKKRAAAAAAVGTYRVQVAELTMEIEARDEAEAWAKFNDAHKTSYGPKYPGRKVEKIA